MKSFSIVKNQTKYVIVAGILGMNEKEKMLILLKNICNRYMCDEYKNMLYECVIILIWFGIIKSQ